MTLTETERLLLINQFRILEKIDVESANDHKKMVEILERGYTREYAMLANGLSKELTAATCAEVYDILEMHRALHQSFNGLPDKDCIAVESVSFQGFDGNNESEHLSYTKFLINRLGYWEESRNAGDGLNSHRSTLDRYRPMVVQWKASPNQHNLTRADLLRIVVQ